MTFSENPKDGLTDGVSVNSNVRALILFKIYFYNKKRKCSMTILWKCSSMKTGSSSVNYLLVHDRHQQALYGARLGESLPDKEVKGIMQFL